MQNMPKKNCRCRAPSLVRELYRRGNKKAQPKLTQKEKDLGAPLFKEGESGLH
jgi:hypothetical protein